MTSVHGGIMVQGKAGSNTLTSTGMIGGHKLGPGNYPLTATPSAGALVGTPSTVKFKLVG